MCFSWAGKYTMSELKVFDAVLLVYIEYYFNVCCVHKLWCEENTEKVKENEDEWDRRKVREGERERKRWQEKKTEYLFWTFQR